MMRSWVWIGCGLLGMTLCTGVGAVWPPAWAAPSMPVVVTVFAGLRMGPLKVVHVAVGVGYLAGRAAAAPPGLVELACLSLGLGMFMVSGRLSGAGRLFFSLAAGGGCLWVQGVMSAMWAMLWPAGRPLWPVGTSSQSVGTCLLAAALWQPMLAIDRRLVGQAAAALRWR